MVSRMRQLRLERMEARHLMAGDITAFVQDGSLFLNEATGQSGGENSVRISQLANGKIRVEGNGALSDGSVSRVNGAAFQDFAVTGNLHVKFGGGDDLVLFSEFSPPKFNEVHIDVGYQPVATSLKLPAYSGTMMTDHDVVILGRFETRGSVSITTGDGDDWVFVSDAIIGEDYGVAANLTIHTGAGADSVQVESNIDVMQVMGSLDIQTYSSLSENNGDVVWLEKVQVYDDVHVRTGGGEDRLYVFTMFVSDDFTFDMGAGRDQATLDLVTVIDDLMARLGDGDDVLSTTGLWADLLSLDGGAGVDTLKKGADDHIGQRFETNWESVQSGIWGGIAYTANQTGIYAQF